MSNYGYQYVPDGAKDLGPVGKGCMGARIALFNDVEWVCKQAENIEQVEYEVLAAKIAPDFGLRAPETIAVCDQYGDFILSRVIPDVTHDVDGRLEDDDFLMWIAQVDAFDRLFLNEDRHSDNVLLTPSGNFIIDHAFTYDDDWEWFTLSPFTDDYMPYLLDSYGWRRDNERRVNEVRPMVAGLVCDYMKQWASDGLVTKHFGPDVAEVVARA